MDNKAYVDAKNKDGDTALYIATKSGNVEICELLLDRGADMGIANKWKDTPLQIAIYSGNIGIRILLLSRVSIDSYMETNDYEDDRIGYTLDEWMALFLAFMKNKNK